MNRIHQIMAAVLAAILMLLPETTLAYYYYPTYSSSRSYSPYNYSYSPYRSSYTPTRTATTMAAPSTTTATTATASNSVEQSLLTLLNQERTKRGLRPLQLDTRLTSVARTKSQDMVTKNYFSHTSPTYGSPAQMLSRFGISYRSYAENIAQGSTAAQIHAMWMNSAGHRANILNGSFTHIGIGAVSGRSGYTATQLFVSR